MQFNQTYHAAIIPYSLDSKYRKFNRKFGDRITADYYGRINVTRYHTRNVNIILLSHLVDLKILARLLIFFSGH